VIKNKSTGLYLGSKPVNSIIDEEDINAAYVNDQTKKNI